MAKQQNSGATAVLDAPAQIAADESIGSTTDSDLASLLVAPDQTGASEERAEPEGPAPDSEDAILSKLQTYDKAFASKPEPLRKLYVEFGQYAKETLDPQSSGLRYVHLGLLFHKIELEEHKLTPTSFDRAAVSENVRLAGRIAGVPESLNRPHEFANCFWLAMLDRSVPGDGPGDPRTWVHGEIPADWFTGNVTYGTLRKLFPCTSRTSKDNELDSWEFVAGWEPWVRMILERLRKGELSGTAVEALYKAKKAAMDKQAKEERNRGMTADQIRSAEEAERTQNREKKLRKVREDAVNVFVEAGKQLGYGKGEFRDLLVDAQIIPPDPKVNAASIKGIASVMQPGDAKLLIQELASLVRTPGDRPYLVLKALINEYQSVVAKAKASNGEPNTIPLKKTGS